MKLLPRHIPTHELDASSYPLFISDVHLEMDPASQRPFLSFLEWVRESEVTHLYFLGDLFLTWLGDDHIRLPDYSKAVQAIKEIVASGRMISIIHGNRDFLLGNAFVQETGCEILGDWGMIKRDGVMSLLTHGDIFCTKDISYIKYRKFIRSAPIRKITSLSPLSMRTWIAHQLRKKSVRDLGAKTQTILKPNQSIIDYLLEGVDCLIFGHTHYARIDKPSPGRYLYNIGGWENEGYLLVGKGPAEDWALGNWDHAAQEIRILDGVPQEEDAL